METRALVDPAKDIPEGWYCLKHRKGITAAQLDLHEETPFFPTLASELQRRQEEMLEMIVTGGVT